VPTCTGVPFHPAQQAEDVVRLVQGYLTAEGPLMVLTAGRAGPLGVDALNTALQDALNPGEGRLREGDPVMATRNNHDTGLMNGMTGRIVSMTERQTTCVFEDVEYRFSPAALSDPTLAYAMTIHRSQGSEWPGVLVVLTQGHQRLLSRQLAYTAVTRARTQLIASGERGAWAHAAQTGAPQRSSLLGALLR
jgi:exodeoxyribonuclease V alpha subunit